MKNDCSIYQKIVHRLFSLTVMLSLAACTSVSHNFAPVSDGWHNTKAASQKYRVQPDDTLYSIAFRYGLDYRQLATLNHLQAPYHVAVGQTLLLSLQTNDHFTDADADFHSPSSNVTTGAAPVAVVSSQPVISTTLAQKNLSNAPVNPAVSAVPINTPESQPVSTGRANIFSGKWLWPARGKILHSFSDAYGGNKGLDIAGTFGEPVTAAEAGKIVYCGTGLKGYGLLIIIKHDATFLSAYAHNNKALVKEGDNVKAGQTIALMGNSDSSVVMLHFEIRRAGKPEDPMHYLTTPTTNH